jgi:hypothetical protein
MPLRAEECGVKSPLSGIPDWVLVLLFCVILLTEAIPSLREKSATVDETTHLPAGYLHLKLGDYRINSEHPPLVKMLAALPLLFVDVKLPQTEQWSTWRDAQRFLYQENDADRLLFIGRVAVLPLALLLACVIFSWTRQLFGREAAAFALLLYTFEPNVLANAGLVHTDFGAACFTFLTIYCFFRLVQRVSISRLVFTGFALGLALATKFSTLTLIPILILLAIGTASLPGRIELRLKGVSHAHLTSRKRKLLLLLVAMIAIGLLAYATVWAAYRFRYDWITPPSSRSSGPWWDALLPRAYLQGLADLFISRRRPAFLMGEISADGWWYYFIVTFLLKSPLPLLLLLAFSSLAIPQWWRKNPVSLLFVLVPVAVHFGIASASRFNIGHRHILPIYPFLFVVAGSLVPWVRQQRALLKGGVGLLIAWYIVSSLSIFPHYLAYFNELAGGPENGYKYLIDSNLDWGQDLKGLKRYIDEHGIPRVWLSYFGTASPDYYGIAYDDLACGATFAAKSERETTPYVAISASYLQGQPACFADFRRRQPIAKVGYSIFIYRLD